jgi:uncharacterized integral membrane protein
VGALSCKMKSEESFFAKIVHAAKDPIMVVYAPIFVIYVLTNTFGSFFVELATSDSQKYLRLILLFLVSAVSGILLMYGVRKAYRSAIRQNVRKDYGAPNLRVISSEAELEVRPQNQYIYRRKIAIKAMVDGERYFQINFGYNGSDANIVLLNSSANAKIDLVKRADASSYVCEIEFIPAIKRGETKEIEYEYLVDDVDKKMGKFLSYLCSFPVEGYLSQTVRFEDRPSAPEVSAFWQSTSYSKKMMPMDVQRGAKSVSYKIENEKLKVGGRYVLLWK